MRAGALLILLALAACNREPSFDERYETAEQEIREKAAELNQDLSDAPDDQAPEDQQSGPAPESD